MHFNQIYNRLRYPGETLSERVVHGGFWVFSLRIVDRGFMLIRTIVLARLLAPNDFGLFGIAMLALATLESFSQTGIDIALIQKKEDTRSYLDSAWTIQVFRGLVIAIIMVTGAPLVGFFFKEPRAIMLTKILAISVLIFDLRNIGIVYFRKELEFHKQFAYRFSGTIADLAVAIPAAFILRSVWALVFGLLARNLVLVIMSYVIHPYRPSFRLKIGKTKELFDFGKFIFGQSIILFLLTHGDDALVGKMLGAASLGLYQLAYRFSNVAATEITHVISGVTFPVYSKLQDNKRKLKEALTRTLKFTTFISIPLAAVIFILAPEFTKVFLGEKWTLMVPAMQAMCLFGAMRSIGATFGPVYQAMARVDIPLKISTIQLLILALIIYPLSLYFGILGTAIAITLSMVLALCLHITKIMEILNIDFVSLFKSVFFPALAGFGMVLIILFLKNNVIEIINYVSVLLLAVIGSIFYFIFVFVIEKIFKYDLIASIASILKVSSEG